MIDSPHTSARSTPWVGYLVAVLLAAGAFFSGLQLGLTEQSWQQSANGFLSFFTGGSTRAETVRSERPDLTEFWRVWDLLDEKFVTDTSAERLSSDAKLHGAIRGLVDSFGDPYTVFLPPTEASSFAEDISGNFSGVGMEVGMRNGLVTIIAPLVDTPADRAGLLAGDVIVRIDETSTERMRVDEAVKLIRGERGTEVVLTIFREGETEFLTFPVIRDTITIPTVKTERVEDTFIITIYSFNAIAESLVRSALQDYAAGSANRLVIDVRGNPGGYLDSAVAIASFFLPSGKVVVSEQHDAGGTARHFRSRGRQIAGTTFTPENLVVLVDTGSASAAEILAGALRDHNVATVIGTQTFGKGSVQELVNLPSGAAVKVTVARWLTPNGTSISEGGLEPDIIISRTPADRAEDRDPQRDAALRHLRGERVESEAFTDQFNPPLSQ